MSSSKFSCCFCKNTSVIAGILLAAIDFVLFNKQVAHEDYLIWLGNLIECWDCDIHV